MNIRTFKFFVILAAFYHAPAVLSRCRTQPGDSTFPSGAEWNALNTSIHGRLLAVVPSARECNLLNCTEAEWTSAVFRGRLPGQMSQYNWEQDYNAADPELCLRNGTTCAQGHVPVYAINATSPEHVQAGLRFASEHDLRVAVKSSGHDLLGRSTAKGSLLIWVHYMQNISFTESLYINGQDVGSAVTAGSGVGLQAIYRAAQQAGKMVVGGTAATVALGGGYVQGAGHSAFSPIFGLAADNALEFQIVLASGELVTVNEVSHPALFWAVRGGGAGSWGVITSATVRTYPTFNATQSSVALELPSAESIGPIMSAHSRHVFDWEPAGHYYSLGSISGGTFVEFETYFPNKAAEDSIALLSPFFNEALELGATVLSNTTSTSVANELVFESDDASGMMGVVGSRLIPAATYQNNPGAIGQALSQLVEKGYFISGCMIGGGQVSLNANISSAINTKWRTAKGHIIASVQWNESTPLNEIEAIREDMTTWAVPVLTNVTGEADSGSYSNEADVREPHFQTTFFGDNYARLSAIKATYDPNDLFIVGAGVGSERWDADGLCTI